MIAQNNLWRWWHEMMTWRWHEIKEVDSKLQSRLSSSEYSNIKEQVSKNQELRIQQLRRKKTRKYRQLKYGEQTPEQQTQNSSVKFSQPNQKEKSNSNNQYYTKRTYAAALRITKKQNQIEQQNQTETKTQQHDEILNNHNHHARNTTYTRSKINTISRQEEQPKNLKHHSIQSNGGGNSDQILAELIHEMQQVTMATESLKKRFDQMLKLN